MSTPLLAAIAARLDAPPFMLPPIRHVRGIVIPAGGDLYNRLAWHLVHALRRLGCKLPVQIWHLPSEADITWRQLFEGEGCEVVDAGQVAEREGVAVPAGGWQLKPFAVRHAPMGEVLLLDADNVPVIDPSGLFYDTGFERHGAMFWPDLAPPRSRGQWVPVEAWRKVGLEHDKAARPFESGQLLVNRRRCLAAIDMTVLLNEWYEELYQVVYGDKDTFLLGWTLTGCRYHMPPRNAVFRHRAINQHDSKGTVVFQHATAGKKEIAAGEVLPGLINRRFAPDAAADLARKMAAILSPRLTPPVEPEAAPEAGE